MRILGTIILPLVLAVLDTGEHLSFSLSSREYRYFGRSQTRRTLLSSHCAQESQPTAFRETLSHQLCGLGLAGQRFDSDCCYPPASRARMSALMGMRLRRATSES